MVLPPESRDECGNDAVGQEVHATRRREFDAAMRPLGERRRRCRVVRAERAGKRLVGLVPGVERDLGHRGVVSIGEARRRALHPQPPDELHRRFADHSSKHPVEVERRQTRLACKRLEVECLIEAPDDVLDGPLHGLFVERSRVRLHLRPM
jgi:hypothetical protein